MAKYNKNTYSPQTTQDDTNVDPIVDTEEQVVDTTEAENTGDTTEVTNAVTDTESDTLTTEEANTETESTDEVIIGETPVITDETIIPDVDKTEDDETDTVESWDDVKAVLSLKTSVDNKLQILLKSGFKPIELFVAFFIDYSDTMTASVNQVDGAKFNTRLYNTLISVLRETDSDIFKIKFDLVNLVFKNGAAEAFNEFRLCRFSDVQKLSDKQLTSYHRLVVLIYSLADASKREHAKKSLSGFSSVGTELNEQDISRLKRYYSI